MIRLITSYDSTRLRYTLDLIFTELLGISYEISNHSQPGAANLIYGGQDHPHIPDMGLLWQTDIHLQPELNNTGNWEGIPVFFTSEVRHPIPFDIFSATFYLVSRYEEYLPYTPDAHGRFPPEASILVKKDWIKLPLVNLWANALKDVLLSLYPDLTFNPRKFAYRSTIDIDMAWKYRNKGWWRSTGALLRDIFLGYKSRIWERLSMTFQGKEDPYYNFDFQDHHHQSCHTDVTYFILLGEHGPFDKNIDPKHPEFIQLIQRLNENYSVGIHPSYASHLDKEMVNREIQRLSRICHREIRISRQHFLRMKLPETYRILLSLGITSDYTMGYTSFSGFRAGIAAEFNWFDLQQNVTTALRVIPFCHMDITPMFYEHKTISEACEDLTEWMHTIARCGGLFSSLWHNESLSDSERWKGWYALYVHTIQTAYSLEKNRS